LSRDHFGRLCALILSLNFFVNATCSSANTIAFTADGGKVTALEGDVPAPSIGRVALPKGSIGVSGNTIFVNAVPEWFFDAHNVLSGIIIQPSLLTEGSNTVISGTSYFFNGEWLDNLSSSRAVELIKLVDGTILSGRVANATDKNVDVVLADGSRRTINIVDISSILSPRAFTFRIIADSVKRDPSDGSYTADVSGVTFDQRRQVISQKPKIPQSTLPGTEGAVSNKQIATMIATDVLVSDVLPAIAIPLIFTRSTLHARQLLYTSRNSNAGQNAYAPQIYSDGTVHYYPTK